MGRNGAWRHSTRDGQCGVCWIQRVDAQWPALLHVDFRAVLAGYCRVIGGILVSHLMEVQNVSMIQLHHARMGVDEWHHRLQGDEEPE